MNYWSQSNENVFVAAHRGWKDKYPENTMAAFRAAIELITRNNPDEVLQILREKGLHK